ncbi:AraC family transcriptional regulator [Xanthocytophaga flava]|uniref:AraC family transcriptional regulator n=1 Tax=Xanthocytophaga flava TaxID=3048013 RepID=UPI0028D62F9D|nr:helix-turn-helix domain-containing protein [Xanthocytophaga flavus]MDJ1469109.1 helix-turn-helix domain-containing protein [Xanthocytophaga flavus]
MVDLQTYVPAQLSSIVKSFWSLQVSDTANLPYVENIIPDGHQEIIFHLSASTAKRSTEQLEWLTEPDAFFAGQTRSPYSLELRPGSLLYGIRFHPHTMYNLFKFPASLITDTIVSVHDIPQAKLLHFCLTEDPRQTFLNFENTLTNLCNRIYKTSLPFQYVDYTIQQIITHRGNIKIESIRQKTGVSQRYLDTIFRQWVGITPKEFSSIIKINHFIDYRQQHPEKKLTECSHENQFFDQSHLIRIFKTFTGQSPKNYFHTPHTISTYFAQSY